MSLVTQVQNGWAGKRAREAWNYALKAVGFSDFESGTVINDATMASASTTNLSTSSAIKAYVDSVAIGSAVVAIDDTDSPYAITGTEKIIAVDASAGSVVINYPTAVTYSGFAYVHRLDQAGGNTVTLTPNGVETIDGQSTITLNAGISPSAGEAVRVYSDGTNLQYL